ncbi:MAG: phosphomannomutase/phosphoglucomutase, partial [Gaiellaceae bacterium]
MSTSPPTPGAPSLRAIFKAYDVRGIVPDELSAEMAYAIAHGFATFSRTPDGRSDLVVARDMRLSGPELLAAIVAGATAAGANVIDIGLASTDMLYFATGYLSAPGIMLTASHNPAMYNGMKFCLANASPVGEESGLKEVLALAEAGEGDVPSPI